VRRESAAAENFLNLLGSSSVKERAKENAKSGGNAPHGAEFLKTSVVAT
jgi:hypothetical protein